MQLRVFQKFEQKNLISEAKLDFKEKKRARKLRKKQSGGFESFFKNSYFLKFPKLGLKFLFSVARKVEKKFGGEKKMTGFVIFEN